MQDHNHPCSKRKDNDCTPLLAQQAGILLSLYLLTIIALNKLGQIDFI